MERTKAQVTELVRAMDEMFAKRDPKSIAPFLREHYSEGWGGGTPQADVLSAVAEACNEAAKLPPSSWPPPSAGRARELLKRVTA